MNTELKSKKLEPYRLNKEKYFRIMREEGVEAALTTLHHDKEKLEFETFEGKEGYQRELWDYLEEVRQISRELWDLSLQDESVQKKKELYS